MSLQVCIALAVIALGAVLAASGQEICQHLCWLDRLFDVILPDALDSFSGGAPVIFIGLILLVHAWPRR